MIALDLRLKVDQHRLLFVARQCEHCAEPARSGAREASNPRRVAAGVRVG
jgi:hypothetical protein